MGYEEVLLPLDMSCNYNLNIGACENTNSQGLWGWKGHCSQAMSWVCFKTTTKKGNSNQGKLKRSISRGQL